MWSKNYIQYVFKPTYIFILSLVNYIINMHMLIKHLSNIYPLNLYAHIFIYLPNYTINLCSLNLYYLLNSILLDFILNIHIYIFIKYYNCWTVYLISSFTKFIFVVLYNYDQKWNINLFNI